MKISETLTNSKNTFQDNKTSVINSNSNLENSNFIHTLKNNEFEQNEIKRITKERTNIISDNKPIVLSVQNLKIAYRTTNKLVIKNISFDVKEEDIVGIVGINGAGKTTTFKAILNIIEYTGEVKLENEEISNVSILWTENGFDGDSTVEQNFKFYYELYNIIYDRMHLLSLLREFKIDQLIDVDFKLLSSGQKRKCAIVRTFIKKSKLILLDEPTGALDLVSQNQFGVYLKEKVKSQKSACIMITHNYKDLEDVCSKVLILNNGEILEYDTVENISKSYLRGYLIKLQFANDKDIVIDIQKLLKTTELNYIPLEERATITYLIRLKDEYTQFEKFYNAVKKYILTETTEKIRFSTLIDLVLSGIIFR